MLLLHIVMEAQCAFLEDMGAPLAFQLNTDR